MSGIGEVKTLVICVPSQVQQVPCPSGMGLSTAQGYIIDPAQAASIDAQNPEVLLNPTEVFVGAYPCISQFAQVETPRRFEVKSKTAQITIDACVEVTKHQFGKYIRVFRELWGDKQALDLICNDADDYWPKRMKPLTSSATTGATPIHELPPVPSFIQFITTVPSFGLIGEHGFA